MLSRLRGKVPLGATTRRELCQRKKEQVRQRETHRNELPPLPPFDRKIVETVEKVGAFVTSLQELRGNHINAPFDLPASRATIEKTGHHLPFPKDYRGIASDDQLRALSQKFFWALATAFWLSQKIILGFRLPIATW